jgi:uncharacterized phage protein (TIGR01671 family)
MKRQIRFRGKRTDTGKWVYGYYAVFDDKHYIYTGEKCTFHAHPSLAIMYEDYAVTEVVPETVGQFTGLLDMNGKEIYEGDISKVNIEKADFITEVKWGINSRGWSLKCDRRNIDRWGTVKYYALPASHNIKVVGNIHDNPGLLTTE